MSYFERPLLVMFLGVPGSGKSYFARALADKLAAVRINGDSMRRAIFGSVEEVDRVRNESDGDRVNRYAFGALDYVAEQILMRGYDVIYDAHLNRRIRREQLEQLATRYNTVPLVVQIQTPLEVAVQRGQDRPPQVDQIKFTEEKLREVMQRQQANADAALDSEHVIIIDGQMSSEAQLESFEKQFGALHV